METFNQLLNGFEVALSWQNLLFCLVGVTLGMMVGILPGLGPSAGTAVLLPITFGMEATTAIILLSGIYYGAMYGGTITSVLINTPGEAASVITCVDGYPMAKQGRAGTALGIAGIGSFIGGVAAVLGLVLIGPPIARYALKFGPPEYFALLLLGMTMVIGLMGKSLNKGLIAALVGLMLAMVGADPIRGSFRYTFGILPLQDGFDFIPIAMGLIGISEIMLNVEADVSSEKPPEIKGVLPKKEEWAPSLKAIGRGTLLGFFIGLIPGTNSVIPSLMSYSLEKKLAKDPSRFGKGAIEGVAGPETANNAYSGGSLIPLFTLGIPSSPTVAILLGAFIMHGLTPGPQLFQKNPDLVWGIIASMFIGNAILLFMNLPMAGFWAKLTRVPTSIMYPMILAISALGAYSISNSLFDVGAMLGFAVLGYVFKKLDIPLAPIVLTFILGGMMESSLSQSLNIFKGDFTKFFTRPISGVVLGLTVLIFLASFIAGLKGKKDNLASDVEI
ncbi:MAG: transporter [Clostridiales bacterium]|nr:transporter [Clostridiales bacterium]